MATATLTEKLQDVAATVREKVEDFDPEELLSVAEETARKLRDQAPVNELKARALDRIKQRPFAALGVAFVAGAALGAVAGRMCAVACQKTGDSMVS
jgi:hypothetical protein